MVAIQWFQDIFTATFQADFGDILTILRMEINGVEIWISKERVSISY